MSPKSSSSASTKKNKNQLKIISQLAPSSNSTGNFHHTAITPVTVKNNTLDLQRNLAALLTQHGVKDMSSLNKIIQNTNDSSSSGDIVHENSNNKSIFFNISIKRHAS
jgi:hypothetical protein